MSKRWPLRKRTDKNLVKRLCSPQHRTKLEALVAAATYRLAYGVFPIRVEIAKFLKKGSGMISSSCKTLAGWGLIRVSSERVLHVLDRGFNVLEELLGYNLNWRPHTQRQAV